MKTGYTISRASRKYPTFKILKGVNDMANMIVDNAKVMSKGQITNLTWCNFVYDRSAVKMM